MARKALIIKR